MRRGPYIFAGEFNPVFAERDKSSIQRRVSKKFHQSAVAADKYEGTALSLPQRILPVLITTQLGTVARTTRS